nr:glycosyltransferase [Bradyrhizobium sp. 160]
MGVPPDRIAGNYDSVSIARIRQLAGVEPAPTGVPFADRHLTIVARLASKKNIAMAIDAYSLYCRQVESPRPLHICGSGPLEPELRERARLAGIESLVTWHGFVQIDAVSQILGHSLALLLPSIEEQFGLCVVEALAMGLPVIVSDQCGARDHLVRSGVNGFVVEPDNPRGLAFFLNLIGEDEKLWRFMSANALEYAKYGDVSRFVESATKLIGRATESQRVSSR